MVLSDSQAQKQKPTSQVAQETFHSPQEVEYYVQCLRRIQLCRDNGMSAEEALHAFEPFGRAGHNRKRRQPGTGLGLSLARSMVRLHGGDLTLSSRPGAGTTATIILPVSAAFGKPGIASEAATPPARQDAAAA